MVLSKTASCWFSQVSVFAGSCTGFVVFLLWFCKDLCFDLEGVRIPLPPSCFARRKSSYRGCPAQLRRIGAFCDLHVPRGIE